MISLRSALPKRIFALLILGISALLLLHFRAATQQSDQRERLVDDKGSYRDCPIKTVGVETSKRRIEFGKSFLDDDDWMKGLTVRIENPSGKVLTHFGIQITFDRPAHQKDQPRVRWDLWYGVSPFYYKPEEAIPPPLVRLIQPGETGSVSLSESDYDAMKALLRDFKFPLSIETIHITV